ncbi:MAG: DUF1376 domain-containing protein [Pseudomonadota bacterium]|jgi:uncharacterized protein YdaU (DUF1376 family)|nr:DUF1376 domain-containing protein [Pseudomonadota bacterium]
MSADSLPFVPWFHRDFLDATQGWTLQETGAYFLLLGAQWGSGPLPNDINRLAIIARTTPKEFRPLWKRISRKFAETPDGLVNERLEQHRGNSLELRKMRRTGAAKTNHRRWGTPLPSDVVPIAERVAERSLSVSHPSPSPSPSPGLLTKGEAYQRGDAVGSFGRGKR